MAHTYNPSYSGGKDQEDHSWKPAQANHLRDPISKKSISHTHTHTHTHTHDWQSDSNCKALSSSPSTEKKEKR
jgi:hypothetical protein